MNQINQALSTKGICYFEDIYSLEELESINARIDPLLASRNQENRSYVYIDELKDLNLFDAVFSTLLAHPDKWIDVSFAASGIFSSF
jgi:hypothetical protein